MLSKAIQFVLALTCCLLLGGCGRNCGSCSSGNTLGKPQNKQQCGPEGCPRTESIKVESFESTEVAHSQAEAYTHSNLELKQRHFDTVVMDGEEIIIVDKDGPVPADGQPYIIRKDNSRDDQTPGTCKDGVCRPHSPGKGKSALSLFNPTEKTH